MDMSNWDKNHVGVKRVVKKNWSQDKHKMTGMYPALNLALVNYSSGTGNLMSDVDNKRENTDCEIRQNCMLNQEGQSCDMNKLEFGVRGNIKFPSQFVRGSA
ncbi:hypothetical protein RRG08_009175 [Elysia crispata]|uniref:Uncharacterized protein n=1 Tax=Elysia crispata TaxID=231223 RepID=A0AAE0ZPL2_9GAST|nr:hypothetical protein RRG08_009175 [Elysia crispata]